MVTAIKMHECKVLNFCKRSFAFLCAVGIMGYSLLTAPLFGVHAVDSGQWDKIKDWVKEAGKTAIDLLVNDPVSSLVGKTIIDVASVIYDSNGSLDTLTGQFSKTKTSVDLGSIYGKSGYCEYMGEPATVTCYTLDSEITTFEAFGLDDVNGLPYHRVASISSKSAGQIDIYMSIKPYNDDGINWETGDTITFRSSFYSNYWGAFDYAYSFKNSSGGSAQRFAKLNFYFYFNSSKSGSYLSLSLPKTSGFSRQLFFYQASNSKQFPSFDTFSDLQRPFNSASSSTVQIFIGGRQDNSYYLPTVGPNQTYTFPSTGVTKLTEENIYNYTQNVSYPYIVNNYPVWQVLPPLDDYEPETTNPSEITPTETTPGTTGTVVIIDPFTLPPEWLEDDAELDTDHYILDSEQWESPFETIARYKSQVSAASIEDEEPWLDNGQLVAPLDVTQAMESFQYFAIELLDRSGILVVVASCLAFGLVIRIISLK